MATYKLTKTAEKDLQRIFEYGAEQFGVEQAIKYLLELEKTLNLIAENPEIARVRAELKGRIRVHPFASNVILYEENDREALILSIRSARENWLA